MVVNSKKIRISSCIVYFLSWNQMDFLSVYFKLIFQAVIWDFC